MLSAFEKIKEVQLPTKPKEFDIAWLTGIF